MTLARLALFALAAVFASSPAHAQLSVEFPLKGADGTPIANHRLAPAVVTQAAKLPGTVVAGNPDGDVTLMQFYDLNCPFCRRAAQDIDELVKSDRNLKMVFVPYPILSAQSVEGGRVELALREMSAQQFLEFRQRIYKTRGTIDGARSLAVVKEMGIELGEGDRACQFAAADRHPEGACAACVRGQVVRDAVLHRGRCRDRRASGIEDIA